jgi:hypothetical protein
MKPATFDELIDTLHRLIEFWKTTRVPHAIPPNESPPTAEAILRGEAAG